MWYGPISSEWDPATPLLVLSGHRRPVGVEGAMGGKVVSISAYRPVSGEQREIAELAYQIWLARCFRNASPEDALLRAEREVRGRRSGYGETAGLFLVRKPGT